MVNTSNTEKAQEVGDARSQDLHSPVRAILSQFDVDRILYEGNLETLKILLKGLGLHGAIAIRLAKNLNISLNLPLDATLGLWSIYK